MSLSSIHASRNRSRRPAAIKLTASPIPGAGSLREVGARRFGTGRERPLWQPNSPVRMRPRDPGCRHSRGFRVRERRYGAAATVAAA